MASGHEPVLLLHTLAQVATLMELDDLLGGLDPAVELVDGGERIKTAGTPMARSRSPCRTVSSTTSTI